MCLVLVFVAVCKCSVMLFVVCDLVVCCSLVAVVCCCM